MTTPSLFSHYVAGEWRKGAQQKPNFDPADARRSNGDFPTDGMAHLDDAVNAAKKAFEVWRKTPGPERGRVLWKAAQIARQNKESIAKDLTAEEGKTIGEAMGEVEKGICVIEFSAAQCSRLNGETVPSEMRNTLAYTVLAPLGVVGLVTPWNFPWAIPAWKTAPALAAGNTCILKPASLTPKCALWLAWCFEQAGLPTGALNVVLGPGGALGSAITEHPAIRAISFTGSTDVGRELAAQASRALKKVSCEMGGKNAVIVLNDADLALAATGIAQGAFGSTGQRCTATSRVVVEKGVAADLTARLEAIAKGYVVGAGTDKASQMGPAVDAKQLKTDLDYIQIAKGEGARLVCGGERLTAGDLAHGHFVAPTVFAGVTRSMRIAQEEVFGPVLSIIEAGDAAEAVAIANDSAFGLSSSIYSQDINAVMRYIDDIDVGIVHINSPTVGGEPQLPFGGTKGTGLGTREMGRQGVEFFTEEKTVYIDYTAQKRTVSFY